MRPDPPRGAPCRVPRKRHASGERRMGSQTVWRFAGAIRRKVGELCEFWLAFRCAPPVPRKGGASRIGVVCAITLLLPPLPLSYSHYLYPLSLLLHTSILDRCVTIRFERRWIGIGKYMDVNTTMLSIWSCWDGSNGCIRVAI